jgi:hypothetical protein
MPEQRYSVNDRRKDFMINHNESDLHRPGIGRFDHFYPYFSCPKPIKMESEISHDN